MHEVRIANSLESSEPLIKDSRHFIQSKMKETKQQVEKGCCDSICCIWDAIVACVVAACVT